MCNMLCSSILNPKNKNLLYTLRIKFDWSRDQLNRTSHDPTSLQSQKTSGCAPMLMAYGYDLMYGTYRVLTLRVTKPLPIGACYHAPKSRVVPKSPTPL